MSNVETAKEIYEAFGRGDVPAMLERLAEDVRWEHHPTGNTAQDEDVPYMRLRHGRDEVARLSTLDNVRRSSTGKASWSTAPPGHTASGGFGG